MQVARGQEFEHLKADNCPASAEAVTTRIAFNLLAPYAASVLIALVCLISDLLLPRGATPAIGYCIIPLIAVRTRRRWFIFLMMGLCTLLTWVGYYLEPPGGPWWMSIFERAMVTWVLWFALLLSWQRMRALAALALKTRALEETTRELARSNVELERFASVVAHDLRSPLSTTALFAGLLARRCAGHVDSDCDEWLSSIQLEINRMGSMIEGLLTYGRVGSRKQQYLTCDCESVLTNVLRNLTADLAGSGVQVTHDTLPTVAADPTQISQLLQNLIENAIKYRGEVAPSIHLAATTDQVQSTFTVQDNGIGIDPAEQEKIFGLFERGHHGAAQYAGAGIGLATCKRIVERHGGRIWVQSCPGQGSTFYFTIPNQERPNTPPIPRDLPTIASAEPVKAQAIA